MNGGNIVGDTSLIINFFNGKENAKESISEKDLWLSGISEIEILASPKLTFKERKQIREFLRTATVIDLLGPIKDIAIELRVTKTLKLPDAIIAATAIYLGFPLCTYDKAFGKVENLNVVLLDP